MTFAYTKWVFLNSKSKCLSQQGRDGRGSGSGNLFSYKQVLYSEPFRSGQEIKVLTSFSHSVKNPEVAMVRLYCWNQKTNMDLRLAY